MSMIRFIVCVLAGFGCLGVVAPAVADESHLEKATFGGGCYWCVEAVFQRVEGVRDIRSGFMGGHVESPTYEQVRTGRSGHAEVVQFQYDPAVVSYEKLLQIFWQTHDPTTKNVQGPDAGPQYRSVVFYHSKEQEQRATEYKRLLNRKKVYRSPVVTLIKPADEFYPAKKEHQNFFNLSPGNRYCEVYIVPKLEKLKKLFPQDVKSSDPIRADRSTNP